MRAKAGQIASHLLKSAIEPNSVASEAIEITGLKSGETRVFSGVLDTTTDVDVFRIIGVTSGTKITADVDAKTLAPPSTLDSFLRLFNAAGTSLASNDDSGGTTDSLVSFTATATEDHLVGVSAYLNQTYNVNTGSGLTTATTTGPYLLKVSLS